MLNLRINTAFSRASQVLQLVSNLLANAGNTSDVHLIPGLRRSLGVRNGNPLKFSFLENFMDRGTWLATVLGVTKVRCNWVTEHELSWVLQNICKKFELVILECYCFNFLECEFSIIASSCLIYAFLVFMSNSLIPVVSINIQSLIFFNDTDDCHCHQ